MREHLIAFIKAFQSRPATDDQVARLSLSLGEGLSVESGPRLSFGYQYAQPWEVILWLPRDDAKVLSVEDGVDEFLKAYGLE